MFWNVCCLWCCLRCCFWCDFFSSFVFFFIIKMRHWRRANRLIFIRWNISCNLKIRNFAFVDLWNWDWLWASWKLWKLGRNTRTLRISFKHPHFYSVFSLLLDLLNRTLHIHDTSPSLVSVTRRRIVILTCCFYNHWFLEMRIRQASRVRSHRMIE